MKKSIVIILTLITISLPNLHAANRYWVSALSGNWNDSANWSTSSGSSGGASVPTIGDFVYFNASGGGNCTFDIAVSVDGINTTGYTGQIDLAGFSFDPAASNIASSTFNGGTFIDTPGTSSLTFTTTGITTFSGTTFNIPINIISGRVRFNGGTFNNSVIVEDNGASNTNGNGGCTFNSTFKVTNSGSSYFLMGYTFPDIFNGDATFINTSTSRIRIAYSSASNQFNGNIIVGSTTGQGVWFGENGGTSSLADTKTIQLDATGFSAGDLRFKNFTQVGTTAQNLTLTGTAYLRTQTSSVFNGNVDFTSPRIEITGTSFVGTSTFEKTGSSNDYSSGGNTFTGNSIFTNSGSGYIVLGNGGFDVFLANLTLNNKGTSNLYLANNVAGNTIAGNLTVNNSPSGSTNYTYIANHTASSLTVTGNASFTNTSTATNGGIIVGEYGDISFGGTVDIVNNATGTSGEIYMARQTNSTVTIVGNTTVTNTGAGTTKRVYLGYNGDITFNGTLTTENTATATYSELFFNYSSNSSNTYLQNITITSSVAGCDGVRFGQNGGSGTLAVGKTINLGAAGFSSGQLQFRNFTQTGTTAQNITLTGTGYLYNYDSDWGGNISFSAPRMNTRGTTYNGTTYLEKTGSTNDASSGGNHFVGNTELRNSGDGYFLMGNGNSDTFDANLTLNNTGTYHMYLAHNSAGNTIGGNLIANNASSGTSSSIYISNYSASTLAITGNTNLNNTSSGTNGHIQFADNGDATIGGNLVINNNSTATTGQVIIGNNTNSTISISGYTSVSNNGASTTKRVYLGNNGDITFNGTLAITNNASASNSEVFCNSGSNSSNTYNQNITVTSTHASCDGVRFGQNGGAGTLANSKTITIGGAGYIAGLLQFRNFTQLGTTPQTLTITGTGYFYNYDSNWGGNVSFTGGRMITRGTTYQGTIILGKTGASDDSSAGGNTFVGNTIINNSGTGSIMLGNGSPDTFGGNVTLNNTGSRHIYLARNSTGNTISGSLTANNNGTGSTSQIIISYDSASTLTVNGNAIFTNSTSGTNGDTYIGRSGDINFSGNLSITNSTTGSNGYIYLASGSNSTINVTGNTTVINSSAGTSKLIYLGNYGDVNFNGTLDITNSSSATNSEVHLNYLSSSANTYNQNITVKTTHASCDGIRFGQDGGAGTLAATKTITIPGVDALNFIGGQLRFRNFTQVGATPQSFELGATASYIYNYNSSWGGNVSFIAPRILTRGTSYSGTVYLEKTGSGNDASIGGNTFTGNTELKNSGSNYFLMGNGSADIFSDNLTLNNTGANHMYLAYNSAGNTIAGDLKVTNSGTGSSSYVYLCNYSVSNLTVSGNTIITNTTTGTNGNIYIGENGDLTLNGNLSLTNNATGANGHILLAQNSNSTVTIAGNTSVTNSGAGTTKRTYLGNSGDVTFNGTLDIINSASASNSEVYCNNSSNSSNAYNGNITVSSTHANSDGIRFGERGGNGTLALTKTITIPGVDALNFIGGQLRFQNFTQTGNTAHSFELGATANYIYNYNSTWGGNTSFTAPRIYVRSSTFSGTSYFEKTGVNTDYSYGGNTYSGNTEFVLNNNVGAGALYMAHSSNSSIGGNLTLKNTGAFSELSFGGSAGVHPISGDLVLINASTGTGSQNLIFGNKTSSTYTVGGSLTATNSATGTSGNHDLYISNYGAVTVTGNTTLTNSSVGGTTKNIYLGNRGNVTIGGSLSYLTSSTANEANFLMGNYSSSIISITGNTSITNAGSGARKRCYLGNYGDITFNGTLDIVNNASATGSEVYLNDRTGSVNTYNDHITIKTTHTSNDGIRFGTNGGSGTLAATKTISIPGVDATNFIGGILYFRNFTQTGATAQSLELGSAASYIYNYNSNWGGNVSFKAPRMYTRGSTYNGTSSFEKTGSSHDSSPGGNTFVGNASIINSGTAYLLFGNGTADVFQANVDLQNNGSHHTYLAYRGAGHSIAGNLTTTNSATGTGDYRIYVADGSNSTLNIIGNTTVNQNGTGKTLRTYFGNSGDITLGGNLTVNNSGAGTTSHVYISNGSASQMTIGGISNITNNSTASNSNRVYVGNYGDITFNGVLNLVNNAGSNESEIYCNYTSNSSNVYNQNITVATYNVTSDGILFGVGGGNGTLASGKTITIPGVDATNYTGGQLYFRNFTQIGGTSQTLELGSNASYIQSYSSTWNGDVDFKGPRIYLRSSTFNGNVAFTKNGSLTDNMYGGNAFAGTSSYTNQGTGAWRIAYNQGNDYNADASFTQSASGTLDPAYNTSNTFAGNITVNSSATIRFGRAGGGRVILDGSVAQSINNVGATPKPQFRDLQTLNTTNDITLNTPITILSELDLDNGNIITTSTNVIYMNDNTTVSSVSNSAFVDGPLVKIGNDAFTFPVGDAGFYSPITMTNPSSSSAQFEGQYFYSSPEGAGFDTIATSGGIDKVSSKEFWILNRLASSNTVKATIGWSNTRSGSIGEGTLCNLRIARWDGSQWTNEGNGGTSGNSANGTIITGSSEDCSTSTKITSWTNDYPITIAVDSNYITWDGTVYDGGSGTAGAPNTADAGRILKVFAPGAVANIDASLDKIIVTPAGRLSISAGVVVTVSGSIDNNGEVTIENTGSLVQTSIGANENSGSGDYIIKRTGNNSNMSYNIWSSPIQDASLVSVFSGANACDMWVFDPTNQAWSHDFAVGYSTSCNGSAITFGASDVISGGDGLMDEGRGYFVPGAVISSKQFTGTVNNGNISIPIKTTSLGNQAQWDDDDWNLVGNPYPSGIDAAAFWTENAINNTRITDAIYFWDDNNTGTGYNQNQDYGSWNALGGVNSGNSATIPNGTIGSGQGFWVVGNANTNLEFNNSMRTGSNDQFFKTNNTEKHLAWISVVTATGFTNNILVGYSNQSTDQIDPLYDAHKLPGNAHVRFASIIDSEEFAIQGFEAMNIGDNKVIPLVLFTDASGVHTFSNYKTENLPSNIKLYIRDLVTGITHDLTLSDYTVTLSGNQEYLNRFELVFENNINIANGGKGNKGTNNGADTTTTTVTGIDTNVNANNFLLISTEMGYTLRNDNGITGTIQVMDVTGKVVWAIHNISQTNTVNIDLNNVSSGLYILEITDGNSRIYQNKILKP